MALFVALTASLFACTPAASVRIELEPASVVVGRGGDVVVTVSVVSATAPGPFTLATGTLPAGVTAAFSEPTLGAAGDSADLTLAASAGAAEGPFTLTVTASGAAASASATLQVSVESLTVSGTVTGLIGQPLAGVTVVSGEQATTTAADGSFSLGDMVLPYDLTVLDAAAGWAETYLQLTSSALDVVPLSSIIAPTGYPTATVTGQLAAPVPAGHRLVLCLEGVSTIVYGCATAYPTDTDYTIDAFWSSGVDVEARLRAVEFEMDASFNPVAITGSGAATPFPLTEGGTVFVDVAVGGTPVAATTTVTMAAPFAIANRSATLATVLPSGQTFSAPNVYVDAPPVSAVTPVYAGASYALISQGTSPDGRAALAYTRFTSAGAKSVTLPQAPSLAEPPDAATGVDGTTAFSVSGTPGRLNYFFFSSPDLALTVVTTEEAVSIPDLSAHGLVVPPSASMDWTVLNAPDLTSVDDGATSQGLARRYLDLLLMIESAGPAPVDDMEVTGAGYRTFTTAP